MKTKPLLLILSCLFAVPFPHRGYAQTADDFNEGLTATYQPVQDVVQVSWWGREFWYYQVELTDDLDLDDLGFPQWTALPELYHGTGAPIQLNFAISGSSSDRFFYRVNRLPIFAENSNMSIDGIRLFGKEQMRALFFDGLSFFPNDPESFFEEGMVFSTGIAADWDKEGHEQNTVLGLDGDRDLEHWMRNRGFTDESETTGTGAFETRDASGIEFDFEVDASVGSGQIQINFIFASDEYYLPWPFGRPLGPDSLNDAMGIFISALDQEGNVIPETRTNLGILPNTETHSRAVNVFNAGQTIVPSQENNIVESGFVNNSPFSDHHGGEPAPPFAFGYSGFTGKLTATGGVARVDDEIDIKTRFRQGNTSGMNRGWGGIVFRGRHNLDYELTAYVAGFGLNNENVEFNLYKVQEHHTDLPIYPAMTGGSNSVTVLDSVAFPGFDQNKWYWIRVQAVGDNIKAKYWEGENEKTSWDIEISDSSLNEGFSGLVHLDNFDGTSELAWDVFKIQNEPEYLTNFSEYDTGKKIPVDWATHGVSAKEWTIVEDGNSEGGKHVQHSNGQDAVSILRLKDPVKLEGGKRYRVKVVVADAGIDGIWDSCIFLEAGSIKVVTD